MRVLYGRVALRHELLGVSDLFGELRDGLGHPDLQPPFKDCGKDQKEEQ